uniref:Uncharacterized protein n=1 Tax=Arundo donax TaxID=35708 RepID=A0A0A9E0R8_ARUDO
MLGTPSRRYRRRWRCTVPSSRGARMPPSAPSPPASCGPRTGAARWKTRRRHRRRFASRLTAASRETSSARGRPPTKCGGGWFLVRLMSRRTLPGR